MCVGQIVMVVEWGAKGVPNSPALAKDVMRRLVSGAPHARADVFKYNVELIRTLVTSWKKVVRVDCAQVTALLETQDGQQRQVEAGLHIIACMLINNLTACEQENTLEVARLNKAVVNCICYKSAIIYNSAAEVAGLMLKRLRGDNGDANLPDSCQELCDAIVCRIMDLLRKKQSQALSCLYLVHKHFPEISLRFVNICCDLISV